MTHPTTARLALLLAALALALAIVVVARVEALPRLRTVRMLGCHADEWRLVVTDGRGESQHVVNARCPTFQP